MYKRTSGENIWRQDFLPQLAAELAADFQEDREQLKTTKETLPKSTTDSHQRKICQIEYCSKLNHQYLF